MLFRGNQVAEQHHIVNHLGPGILRRGSYPRADEQGTGHRRRGASKNLQSEGSLEPGTDPMESLKQEKTKTEGSGNVLRRRRTILAWGFALPFVVVFCVFKCLIPPLSRWRHLHRHHLQGPPHPVQRQLRRTDQYIALFHEIWSRFLARVGRLLGIFGWSACRSPWRIALAFAVASTRDPSTSTRSSGGVLRAGRRQCGRSLRRVECGIILQKDGLLNSLLAVFGIADRTGCTTPATYCPR